jgi:two-component system, cell cycle sensor histidine kinase and response regulator CckA
MSDGDTAGPKMLRILLLEDDPRDAELAQRLLTREGLGFTATVVVTRAAFEAELTAFRPDVILSDFSLPGFSGATALEIAQERCPHIPFIIMSGVLGDESAVELIKQGATDYVLKDRPARLPSVIRRAVAEAAQRARLAQLEAELRRWQRMASLGRLAAGAAYEFNNEVGVMLKSAAAIREKATHRPGLSIGGNGWDGVRKDAEHIQHAGSQATRLVHQLLEAAGQEMVSSELIDLNQVVSGTEELLRSTIGEHVEFRLSPALGLSPVQADPGQVKQVLLNLAVNAREAMPDGGVFSIAMKNVTISGSESLSHPGLGPGDYVCVSASDTGSGMEPEVLEHALEPFFTTKPFAAGGGLGLASVYGIVRQAGGTVDISSAPGAGTTVTAWLRAVTSDVATSTGAPASIGQTAS